MMKSEVWRWSTLVDLVLRWFATQELGIEDVLSMQHGEFDLLATIRYMLVSDQTWNYQGLHCKQDRENL